MDFEKHILDLINKNLEKGVQRFDNIIITYNRFSIHAYVIKPESSPIYPILKIGFTNTPIEPVFEKIESENLQLLDKILGLKISKAVEKIHKMVKEKGQKIETDNLNITLFPLQVKNKVAMIYIVNNKLIAEVYDKVEEEFVKVLEYSPEKYLQISDYHGLKLIEEFLEK